MASNLRPLIPTRDAGPVPSSPGAGGPVPATDAGGVTRPSTRRRLAMAASTLDTPTMPQPRAFVEQWRATAVQSSGGGLLSTNGDSTAPPQP